MRYALTLALTLAALAVVPMCALASAPETAAPRERASLSEPLHAPAHTRAETLWIFDADFEDLVGDNAGWATSDESGTPERVNYWHKDTIRINGFEHLGDSTWWCGTYNDCWRQPRGYGNEWVCILRRSFPEVAGLTDPGDPLFLEYDQRFAIESCYDYGYVEVSAPGDTAWTTIVTVSNEASCPGFEWPGRPKDWDSTWWYGPGHMLVDLSAYSGVEFELRFRFESDGVYSSQDQYNNWLCSMQDGAWQLDNITLWTETPDSTLIFLDDCESPGDNGWVHESIPAAGQVGVVFQRCYENLGGHSGWMMAAYDSTSGAMVDRQWSMLFSPPIDISDAPAIAARWKAWVDLPPSSYDYVGFYVTTHEDPECLWQRGRYAYGAPEWWLDSADPGWGSYGDDWSEFAGGSWLGIRVWQSASESVSNPHGKGMVLDRMRVGIPFATSLPDGGAFHDGIVSARPNPFNPRTSITYTVSRAGTATLGVYDLSGRHVRTLVEGHLEVGEYEVVWDGSRGSGQRVASGVYLLRLETEGGGAVTRKTVLLK